MVVKYEFADYMGKNKSKGYFLSSSRARMMAQRKANSTGRTMYVDKVKFLGGFPQSSRTIAKVKPRK
jgi:hypothetical protein